MGKQQTAPSPPAATALQGAAALPAQTSETPDTRPQADAGTRNALIRQAAFARYAARHGEAGLALDDWLQAERALDQAAAPTSN